MVVNFAAQLTYDYAFNDAIISIEGVIGSAFADVFYSSATAESISGGAGSDTVSYAYSQQGVIVDLGSQLSWDGVVNDTFNSIENAIGSGANDTLYGDAGTNTLDGGAGGADAIYGGGGTDTVSYATSQRSVIIDMGSQLTWDGLVNDTLNSIENAIGSAGNDTFYASGGPNTLTGGGGDDFYVFRAGFGVDVITDFTPGNSAHDTIQIAGLGQTYTSLMSHAVQTGADVVITIDANDKLTLQNVVLGSLTSADFVFTNSDTDAMDEAGWLTPMTNPTAPPAMAEQVLFG